MQCSGIQGDEATARGDRMRRVSTMCGGDMRDGDLEKSVAGNVDRFSEASKRHRTIATSLAAHQRAEVVRSRDRGGPRCRFRRSATERRVMTAVIRVTAGAAYVCVVMRGSTRNAWSTGRTSCKRSRRRRCRNCMRCRCGRRCHNTRRGCMGRGRHGEPERRRKRSTKDRCVQVTQDMAQNMPVLFLPVDQVRK